MTGVAEHLAANLLRCRRHAYISQEELAARASLHRTEIGKLECAERVPRIDTLIKLAGALGIPAEQLLEGLIWEPGYSKVGKFALFRLAEAEAQPKENC